MNFQRLQSANNSVCVCVCVRTAAVQSQSLNWFAHLFKAIWANLSNKAEGTDLFLFVLDPDPVITVSLCEMDSRNLGSRQYYADQMALKWKHWGWFIPELADHDSTCAIYIHTGSDPIKEAQVYDIH